MINDVAYEHKIWTLFKPKQNAPHCYFKNTKSLTITVFFSTDWLQENLFFSQIPNNKIADFFSSTSTNFLICPDIGGVTPPQILNVQKAILNKSQNGILDSLQLKIDILSFLKHFFDKYETENIDKNYYEISNNDRLRILKVEKYLSENLNNKFDTIEVLAAKFNVSTSKLKVDFKIIFGKPIFQYFQELQMCLAKELLASNTDIRINELATRFGYENAGKFSLAFKKQFNQLPSQFLNADSTFS